MDAELVIVKPDELFLKSEPVMKTMMNKLAFNVKMCLKENDISFDRIEKKRLHILIHTSDTSEVINALKNVFGISVLSEGILASSRIDTIKSALLDFAVDLGLDSTKSFAVRAKRLDKGFELTSKEIEFEVGGHIQEITKAKVDLDNPDVELGVEISGAGALLTSSKHKGLGGLPVGVSGKVLCLMTDSFESILSAWMMLKRGCDVVCLHFRSDDTINQKYLNNCKILNKFSRSGSKIKCLSEKGKFDINKSVDIATHSDCKALVLGCEEIPPELTAWVKNSSLPIFTPLIGLGKKELKELRVKVFE